MTHINQLNAETRLKANIEDVGDRLAALLIAVYRLPIDQRKLVLTQMEHNYEEMVINRQKPAEDEPVCSVCNGDGYIDIDGDCGDHGWDKIGEKACPVCYPPYEDPIQD